MTTPTVARARAWTPSALARQADEWRRCGAVLDAELAGVARAVDDTRDHWGGGVADAARRRGEQIRELGARTVVVLAAAADAASEAASRLGHARIDVLDAVDEARTAGFDVGDDGAVAVSAAMTTVLSSTFGVAGAFAFRVLERRAAQHGATIRAALGDLGAVDETARSRIASAFALLPGEGQAGTGWAGVVPVPIPPPVDASAVDNRRWWDSLTPDRQRAAASDDVGGRDGLPADVRHRANLARLPIVRAELVEVQKTLSDSIVHLDAMEAQSVYRELSDVTDRIADLDAIEVVLRDHPDRRLLLLDADTGLQVRAAVAVGDPDTADHVAVTAPGMNTTVRSSLGSMVDEAELLRGEASNQLQDNGAGGTVATVAWIGYDPPRTAGNVTDIGVGGLAVASESRARAGARDLARFYDGLGVAHRGPDLHLTAIGHSYGSVTTGLALREPGHRQVDDAVVYGSPGLVAAHSPTDVGLTPGHLYEMTADGDVVARLGRFGPRPDTADGVVHLSTESATTPDGTERVGASGHSEYARADAAGRLRTSGYNLAAVVAGLPGNVLLADGSTPTPVNPVAQ
ncbi:alpha/beta hydrolase [Prescottella subtropica]|uniref:alpha/beta hydrolase n=1 Tax=Prescottella subtropica TaxID=2545757 RepID=UPI0010F89E7A|nr:alpha/beta hydrolase [Prescottella subtropica]